MYRYKLTIEYDGTALSGWQRQQDAISVQQYIEEAIYSFCGEIINLFGSGRTDAGVHAIGQVAHFTISKQVKAHQVQNALNFYLKEFPIKILSCCEVDLDFHARFSAKKRHYKYIILNRIAPPAIDINRVWHVKKPLSIKRMRKGASYLIGDHDFSSFRCTFCQAKSPVKTLDLIEITSNDEYIYFHVTARSFLHHMVRNIVGTLKLIGEGKWEPEYINEILAAKSRVKAGPTAPAYGLYLTQIDY